MSKLRLIINPSPPDNSDSRSIERGGSLREPFDGNPQITWQGLCRLRTQLDAMKAAWNADTQPIERCWYIVWSKQLDTAMNDYLNENPGLKAGER